MQSAGDVMGLLDPSRVSPGIERIGDSSFYAVRSWDLMVEATARVEDKLYVYADRDIEAGEEITVDYRSFNLVPEGITCWCPEGRCQI